MDELRRNGRIVGGQRRHLHRNDVQRVGLRNAQRSDGLSLTANGNHFEIESLAGDQAFDAAVEDFVDRRGEPRLDLMPHDVVLVESARRGGPALRHHGCAPAHVLLDEKKVRKGNVRYRLPIPHKLVDPFLVRRGEAASAAEHVRKRRHVP